MQLLLVVDGVSAHLIHLYLTKINLSIGSKINLNTRYSDIILSHDISPNIMLDLDLYSTTNMDCTIKINKSLKKVYINATLPEVSQQIRSDTIAFVEGVLEVGQWSGYIDEKHLKTLEHPNDESNIHFTISVFVKNMILKTGTEVWLPQPGSTPLSIMFSQANFPNGPPGFNGAMPPPPWMHQHQGGSTPSSQHQYQSGPPSSGQTGPAPSSQTGPAPPSQTGTPSSSIIQNQQLNQTLSGPPSSNQHQQVQQHNDRQAALAAVAANTAHDRQIQAANAEIAKKNSEMDQLRREMEEMKIQLETSKRQFSKEVENQVRARMAFLNPPSSASILLNPTTTSTVPPNSNITTVTTAVTTPASSSQVSPAPPGANNILPPEQVDLLRRTPLPEDNDEFRTPLVTKPKKRRKMDNLHPAPEGEEVIEEVEDDEDEYEEYEEDGEHSEGIFDNEEGNTEKSRKSSLFEHSNPFESQEILDSILEKIREAVDQGNQSDPEPLVAAVQLLLPKISSRTELELLSDFITRMTETIGQRDNISQSLKSKIRSLGHEILKINRQLENDERKERAAAATAAKTGTRKKIIPTASVDEF